MADPQRKFNYDDGIQPDIHPDLHSITGGGETDSSRVQLHAVDPAKELSQQEKSAADSNVIQGPWGSRADRDSIHANEQNPDTPTSNNLYNPTGKKKQKVTGKLSGWRKKSPIIGVILTLLGVSVGLTGIGLPALLPIHVMENLVSKYDTQNTSMTIRLNKLIANKITNDTTSGQCNIVKIACRFSRPSSSLLTKLDDHGIKALDKNHNVIDPKKFLPNQRPAYYTLPGETDLSKAIPAKDFSKTLNTNSDFRAAFHDAYNPKYVAFKDSVFKKIEVKNGFTESDKLANAKNEDDVTKTINDSVKGDDGGAKAAAANADTADSFVDKLVKGQALKAVTALRNSSRGSGASLIAGAVCLGTDIPELLISTARAYQMAQDIRFAMNFLTPMSALKASAGTPTEGSAIGNRLTTVVNGKSAMESFGMKSTLDGDTKPSSKSYQKFIPGGTTATMLSSISGITDSPGVRQGCNVATNPATGASLNGVLVASSAGDLGTGAIAAAINYAVGWSAGQVMDWIAPTIIDGALKLLAPQVEDLLAGMFGDVTQNIVGEDVGNALVSGASHMMGQTANAGGNMPLTIEQALAYNNETQQVQLAYAQEDRATLNPLDASNSNTFLGSIVNKLLPYYTQTASLTGILSNISSIATGSFDSLFQANAVTVNRDQYNLCTDPAISANDVAAGPFCNIYYGVPPQYLDMDPETIVNDLVAKGDIDENTGNPVDGSAYKSWIDLCTDGDSVKASSCEINSQETAEYSLYTIDHRIQRTMDGEDTPDNSTSTSSTAGNMIDQASLYIDSTSVACAPGTTDAGIAQGYRGGKEINIRLCSIPNTIIPTYGTPAQVNSRVSGAFLALINKLITSPVNGGKTPLRIADSFRTYAQQQYLYEHNNGNKTAQPGYSNHQMGLAIDFQMPSGNSQSKCRIVAGVCQLPGDPVFDWLKANAASYGITQLNSEYWHWQPTAADQG